MSDPLLTIAIPTYNRSFYLDRCLENLLPQVKNNTKIEVLISNNASTDDTESIIKKHQGQYTFEYKKQEKNIGADDNFLYCLKTAKGKYFWMIGDDDFVSPHAVKHISSLLEKKEYGVVYIEPDGYKKEEQYAEIKENMANDKSFHYKEFDNPLLFFKEYHYWATFISSTIVHKKALEEIKEIDFGRFKGTSLIQLGWHIPPIFLNKPNVKVYTKLVVAKQDNSNEVKLVDVFCTNYNIILNDLVENGLPPYIIDITNKNLIQHFFSPRKIVKAKWSKTIASKNPIRSLEKAAGKYPIFWLKFLPKYLLYDSLYKIKSLYHKVE